MPRSTHDAYIAAAPAFARPILVKLRAAMHAACPQVEETIKWGSPCFEHHGLLAGMAAFKAHVRLSFWHGAALSDPERLLATEGKTREGGMRLEQLADLPSARVLQRYIKEAVRLNEQRATTPRPAQAPAARRTSATKRSVDTPADLLAALKRSKRALDTFEGFSYSNRKDYVEWITTAKRAETRSQRVAQAVEWMAEGKPRNWKYMKSWR